MPTAGGVARRLTAHVLGGRRAGLEPDSTRLAYTARVPEPGRYGTDESVTPDKEPPRLITSLRYRLDDFGFLTAGRSQVFVVDCRGRRGRHPPAPPPVQLTTGDADYADVGGAPTAARSRSSAPGTRRDDATSSTTCSSAPPTARGCAASPVAGRLRAPAFSPDGAALLHRRPRPGPGRLRLRRTPGDAVPGRPPAGARAAARPGAVPPRRRRPATVVVDGGVLVGVQRARRGGPAARAARRRRARDRSWTGRSR